MAVSARPRALIVGAGASGRGHMGQLAFESGYTLAFLDRDAALCRRLREKGSYEVELVSAHPRTVVVDGFEIHHTAEMDALYPAFREASVIFTTVCPENVPEAARELAPLFTRWLQETGGKPAKNVLCCENMNNSTTTFRRALVEALPAVAARALDGAVGFPDTMIARVVTRPHDPLKLRGEEYSEWTADRASVRGAAPVVKTLEFVEAQDRYLQRKLYIHNTGHATFGYLGFLKGYRFVHEAAQDPDIMSVCVDTIEESGWAVGREHGFSDDVILAYRKALTDKCVLPQLPDELERVVRDPLRKLGPTERFFGPVGLLLRHGRTPDALLQGVAAALVARIPGDAQSQSIASALAGRGVAAALELAGTRVPATVVAAIEARLDPVRRRFARGDRA